MQNVFQVKNLRNSKDKLINTQGKKLLDIFDSIGGIILNGRVIGDLQGEFTFCGPMGSSVIDYGVCSYNFLEIVENFAVASKPFSDHMPLILKLNVPMDDSFFEKMFTFSKLTWNEKFANRYKQNFDKIHHIPGAPIFVVVILI